MIPHPPFYLSEIRPTDIWLLLSLGFLWEFGARLYLLSLKRKSPDLLQMEDEVDVLQQETDYKRKLGPSHFVETSKLERQLLSKEKDLEVVKANRQKQIEKVEKVLLRYGNIVLALTVFIVYYGVPVFVMDTVADGFGDEKPANMKALLFPISVIGVGARVSKFGMAKEIASNAMGALITFWSSQVTTGKLMDAVDAYVLN